MGLQGRRKGEQVRTGQSGEVRERRQDKFEGGRKCREGGRR